MARVPERSCATTFPLAPLKRTRVAAVRTTRPEDEKLRSTDPPSPTSTASPEKMVQLDNNLPPSTVALDELTTLPTTSAVRPMAGTRAESPMNITSPKNVNLRCSIRMIASLGILTLCFASEEPLTCAEGWQSNFLPFLCRRPRCAISSPWVLHLLLLTYALQQYPQHLRP